MLPTDPNHWRTRAHAARAEGQRAWVKFCQAIAEGYDSGDATYDELAIEFEFSNKGRVAEVIAIGKDARIEKFASRELLPISKKVLYNLTTLGDDDFYLLAKPDTTEEKILSYKRALAAPKQATKAVTPSRPPCPGVEGTKGGEYSWDEKDKKWYKHTGRQPEIPWIGTPSTTVGMSERGARDYMISVFTEIVINNPGDAYKMLASKYHPDRNKSPEAAKIMSQLNLAKEALK